MMFSPLRHTCLLAGLSLMLGVAAHAAGGLEGSSPFAPPASAQAATTATPDAPIELRGIMADGDQYMFSIFDTGKKSSTWARLNESGRDFVIKSFDEARDLVTVEQSGRLLTLTLKAGKVGSAPGGVAAAMPRPPTSVPVPIGGPVVLNPTPADEQRRLEAVATEVRRRRALREQAAQQANQAQK